MPEVFAFITCGKILLQARILKSTVGMSSKETDVS
jgi:hypothetical protein